MKKINLYGHFGSSNHGNEAIVRGITKLFDEYDIELFSMNKSSDIKFGLNNVCHINEMTMKKRKLCFSHIVIYAFNKLFGQKINWMPYNAKVFLRNIEPGEIYILEAGDQYCEPGWLPRWYAEINKTIKKKGGKTVFWCGTINKEILSNKKILADLRMYNLVIAREMITFNVLKEYGFQDGLVYSPCASILMEPKKFVLPALYINGHETIGITIGDVAQGKSLYSNRLFNCIRRFIDWVLSETQYNIALIPHVNVSVELTDITFLSGVYTEYCKTNRVCLIDERRADELKYAIGNCDYFITLRTHASLAAYSQNVPTLVCSYSQKSKGIAQDIFKTDKNYVIDLSLENKNDCVIDAFKWLAMNNTETVAMLKVTNTSSTEALNYVKKRIEKLLYE